MSISLFQFAISLPRSLYVNFRALPFKQAMRLPIVIANNTRISGKITKDTFQIEPNNIHTAMIKIGFLEGSFKLGEGQNTWIKFGGGNSHIKFRGICLIARGSKIEVSKNSSISFGHWFSCNANTIISSGSNIVFEDYIRLGWNCTVIDGDGHDIYDCSSQTKINANKPIHIGAGSWLCAHSTVMKGVTLSPETIVPYGSIITKSCNQPFVIFGGIPNKIIKENVYRKDKQKGFKISI